MLDIKPTEHLTGITIKGDYNDFNELVDAIYRIVGINDNENDMYYGVKNRLLGMCYDIRHAYMGHREIVLEDNGMNEELMKWHNIIAPFQNVYYSVNILFPEAIFLACSVPVMCRFVGYTYGTKRKGNLSQNIYVQFIKDKSCLEALCAGIWTAFLNVVGEEESEKIYRMYERTHDDYQIYVTQYIDKCNVELMKTDVSKRNVKVKNIAKRIVKRPQAYYNMEESYVFWAKKYGTSIYELEDPLLEYPEIIEW